ncbi:2-amino-4-hydroxy-6-hydroxymethyldihydropteridine pyrophosphokinase [Rubidibacter lacunae KORDI 51-2]|uniref:2-amino-4-hydroxy-6-hydroxymethyldihydropteridine diphosphokinase n=1 Tax=Rubidibacter lacunae KORDI 51-2 TaxID=582515 RepID=U5DIU9_9CHRO|nr:2-amino-4-hydroxy-6-hydroxymethyldihydropteridine diphosphokinase [Rubidibacter lacunae]ERN40524.1 2-amino-4-hydroxy-6-hydroxymethyldihydropteridine pyrophosphokinase [Rubidibacter lacunae KORDI 51-2]
MQHPGQPDNPNDHDERCAIALGGNLGNVEATLTSALADLNATDGIRVETKSRWYRTAPVGPPQPEYLNGCALLTVSLLPVELLAALQAIEAGYGRERRERWGPRTLDLDVLLYGDRVVDLPRLQIPHPHLGERAFVLVPLAEIAADWIEPRSGLSIGQLAARVGNTGVRLAAAN